MSKESISKLTKKFIADFSPKPLDAAEPFEQVGDFDVNAFDNDAVLKSLVSDRNVRSVTSKNCIILHGWNQVPSDMASWVRAIETLPEAKGYRFWPERYNTNKSFPDAANEVIISLRKNKNVDFSKSLVIAYSMGGIVARSMFVQGFVFGKLVTICTPHQGLAKWVPTPTFGPASIAPWSPLLSQLNNLQMDRNKRNDYYFFGITRTEWGKRNTIIPDDGVVEVASATGVNLPGVAMRSSVNLNYDAVPFPPSDPHSSGTNPMKLGYIYPYWIMNPPPNTNAATYGPVMSVINSLLRGVSLRPGETLGTNKTLKSENGLYKLTMQSDGNLVLYGNDGKPVWATNTNGSGAVVCDMQHDGNLVLYNNKRVPIWASKTNGNHVLGLTLQDDRNLVIYRSNGNPIWATGTNI